VKYNIYFGDENVRFALGRSGNKPLFVIGINPNKANCYKSDPTIRKVEKLVSAWEYDGFLMLNLYPVRESKPENLCERFDDELMLLNEKIVKMLLCNFKRASIWAAWGDAFDVKDYFKNCLDQILRETTGLNLEWNRCESLTNSQNPRHPLGGQPHTITEQSQLTKFDVAEYLTRKKQN
jgi:hypothetical protein